MEDRMVEQISEELIGSEGIIKKVEFIRLMTDALYSLGYDKSAALLEQESEVTLRSSEANAFIDQIRKGKWNESVATLHKLGLEDENILKHASFLIWEQKFFELLGKNKEMDALYTLRQKITPNCTDEKKVHQLSCCLVCSQQHKRIRYSDEELAGALLKELQKLFPPEIMIVERRLEHLVEQALLTQCKDCVFHNSLDSSVSLYWDHQCRKEDWIPSYTVQTLLDHSAGAYVVSFSNNGKLMVSSSSDKTAIIWEVPEIGKLSVKHRLTGLREPIETVAWSPDDSQLFTCGIWKDVRQWDVSTGECVQECVLSNDMISHVLDGKCIVCWQKDIFINPRDSWIAKLCLEQDATVTTDFKWVVRMCKEKVIQLLETMGSDSRLIEEASTIHSFSLSRDGDFLLTDLRNQKIHLWSIKSNPKLMCTYKGRKCKRYVIRSRMGGLEQAFIASGSVDSQVYIWHKGSGEPIQILSGHSGMVVSVSWNPANPHMLASASEDGTIRIWGTSKYLMSISSGI